MHLKTLNTWHYLNTNKSYQVRSNAFDPKYHRLLGKLFFR